ncbi:MAG: 2-deoxy-D-gluconate 3-dehydrogenase [Chloroflexi bacterium]|nr:MAG: 2-deoxy-D-gluconate 3-dehydrogenase [Chloroflexota bacterium]
MIRNGGDVQLIRRFDLTGKVAIVTGGNGGIGRAIAIGLAQTGADIVIADQNDDKVAEVTDEIKSLGRRCMGIKCDATNYDDITTTVEKTVRECGGLNILINAAGVTGAAPPESMPEEEWDRVVDINLKASFRFCQAAYPALVKAGGGKIINIGSIYAFLGSAVAVHYAVSKGGVVQMTKSLALAWANDNIQVNAILPGFVRTGMTSSVIENEDFCQSIIQRAPAGRFGEPSDISPAAVFLASSASDFITGQSIVIDGGYSVA